MLPIFKDDPHLCSHESNIMHRINAFRGWKEQFRKNEGGVDQFAEGYKTFGFQRHESEQKWTFTEWLPEARSVFLIGDFNNWENTHPLKPGEFGRWSIDLPDKRDGKWAVPHRSQFRLRIQSDHGSLDRVPAWTKLACKNREIGVFNGIMWEPPPSERYVMRHARPPRPANLKIYEAHLGIAGTEERIHTYLDFKDILPRIKRLGYNALQIMAVAEHANASSFGYQVTSFFAPSSRFGTPDELKELVDTAHAYGLTVLMDLVHSHCSSNQVDGIAAMDGTDHCYTHGGHKGKQDQWHASLFDYGKYEVLRFLLSNIRWWIEEYGFDGFRFGGVTSMLYISHGIGKHFGHDYHQYFGMDADTESGTYMMLANYLVKRLLPRSGLTIAEDFSSMPTLCRAVDDGGFGFDYNLSVNIPPMWAKLLQEQPDETWSVSRVVKNLQKRRFKEPCITFAESHDQAKAGARTLASNLMDAEMYAHMSIAGPESMVIERGLALHKMIRMVIERGLALHKMIRLVCMGLGGEGYLNFMGNEFAHPDFVDLPSEANGWSLQNAIRRFDLPQAEDLKYKFFEAFDEAMLALENRFKFMASPRYFCSRKDDSDKVVVFEHGDCLFVFNFHPKRSYTEYRVGHSWNENMRVVLDSDEPCFGGQDRLASAHETSFPPLDGWDSRYHSAEMFLPSRTVQVLVRESLLEGGVTVCLGTGPTSAWPFPAGELLLAPVDGDGGVSQVMKFTVSEGRLLVKLPGPSAFKVYWEVHKGGVTRKSGAPNPNATKVKLPFALDTYRVYFPGTYILDHLGNLKCESDAAEQGDGVPQGCKDVPSCVSRPQYVRAKSQNFLAPSEMPEEPVLEAASHNLPDTWVDVESPKSKRERCKKESSKKAEASETMAADAPKWAPAPDKSEVEAAKPEAFDISSDSDESEVLNGQAAKPQMFNISGNSDGESQAEHTDLPQDDVQEAPMDVPVDAPIEPPMDAPMDAPMDPPMDPPMDLPMDAPMEPPMDAPMEAPMVAPMDLSDAAEAQSVPQGSDETVPPCVSGPQYEWAKPNFLAPSETPEEPLLEAASHNLSDTWVDAKRDRGKQDACDFLAMLLDQPLAAGVVKQVQSASDVPQLPGRLPARKGSMSLLPEPSSEASSLVADPSQDGQNSRSQSRRRRRRSNKDRSTGRSRQPKADQAKGEEYEDFKPPALQETDLAWLQGVRKVPLQQAARIKALEKEQAAVRTALAEAQAARMQREAEEEPPMLNYSGRKGSRSLLPDLPVKNGRAEDYTTPTFGTQTPRRKVSDLGAESSQDGKSSQSQSRRRRRGSNKDRSTGRSWQPKEIQAEQLQVEAARMQAMEEAERAKAEKEAAATAAAEAQDGKSSHSLCRRRRRGSNKDRSAGRSWQPKEIQDEQLQAERAKAEEEAAAAAAAEAQAARIQALEEKEAAVRRALAEEAARMQREAEEAEMRPQQEAQAAALQAAKMRAIQEQEATRWPQERSQEEHGTLLTAQRKEATRWPQERSQEEHGTLLTAQRKGSMSLLPEPEAEKSQPLQTSPQAVVSNVARARQVAQPKFARGAPQARSSKSLPPKKEASTGCESMAGKASSIHYTQPQVQARLMEEPPMLNYNGRQGSLSLLPDLPAKPQTQEVCAALDKMEAQRKDLPQDDVQEASNLSLQDWAEGHHNGDKDSRKEGHTTPTSGTQTPRTKALSEPNSDSGPETMERVFSLSALDSLLQDPEGKADLRHQLELDELEDRRPKYTSRHLNRPVVVVSSEVNPWSKTGGLAMVAGSYGYEFAMRGHRTMVVSPRYDAYDGAHYVGYAKIWLDGREHEVQFFHLYQDLGDGNGTDYIFVGHDCFRRGGLYCDPHTGKEYLDNLFRFSLLTVAALEAPLILNIRGQTFGQDVLFIANDWQTGLLPIYHLYKYRRNNTYRNSRCVFVIHNIGYQGKYRLSKFPIDSYLGLPPDAIGLLQGEDLNLGDDCMNLMSAPILASDRVLTVSPNYAAEIQSPEGGQGLHEILQQKGHQQRMAGILNGIADEWSPKTDPHIPTNYSLRNFDEGKALCKKELQRSLGLHEDPGAALIGFCGRLCYQKGVHLITQIIPWLLTYESSGVLGRVQIILMGKGDDTYANQLSDAENHNKGRVCSYVGFDPKIEHRMLAGCDFLMMPSQYEPCGLPQMYAQAYGTVPVVHETGGLKDSVSRLWDEHRDRETATGFLFCGFDENHLKERMYQALEVFHKKHDLFRQIQMNGLGKNYYWPQAIDEYERQLDWTLDSDAAVS